MQLLLYVQKAALAGDNETPRTVSTLSPAASEDSSRTCSGYKTPDPHIHPHRPLCISYSNGLDSSEGQREFDALCSNERGVADIWPTKVQEDKREYNDGLQKY